MAGFLSRLFGGSGSSGAAARGEAVDYKGYVIYPAPEPEGSQWRLAGYIAEGKGENARESKFVRADLLSSKDEADEFAVRKARQIIDERGDRLFDRPV